MSGPDVLAVSPLSPFYAQLLESYGRLHDRVHQHDPVAFARLAPQVRAIAASGESKVDAALIAQLPALEVIAVMGVGYDGVDVAAARARGLRVSHTPNVLNDDVADLALGLMLAVSRALVVADAHVRQGRWPQANLPLQRKMSGARLGLVGMGRIGQAIAHRALAFGMAVAYTSRRPHPELPYAYLPSAEALAAQSDYLVLITPGGAATQHMVNAQVLRALGPQGILVNVARGSVVDEAALIEALQRGEIAGAGLDVFEKEPHVPQALRDLPQVVLTPHVGSATEATRQAMAQLAFDNLKAHFDGDAMPSLVPECQPV